MDGSGTIQVRKRDGSEEPFQPLKLAGAMWRGIEQTGGRFQDAVNLAHAIRTYLARNGRQRITTSSLFEMVLKVLRTVRMEDAGQFLEIHRMWRALQRDAVQVRHGPDTVTAWDKTWLAEHIRRSWQLSSNTARILAGCIEADILDRQELSITRRQVLEKMNAVVAQFGLADAVPLRKERT